MKLCLLFFSIILFLMSASARAAEEKSDFATFLAEIKKEALKEGISAATIDAAFANLVAPDARVLRHDRAQPESKSRFTYYKKSVLNKERIAKGRKLLRRHKVLLHKIEKNTGVPGPYIVALWGVESDYGSSTGGFQIIPALATLAYDGRRADFFRKELIAALWILEQGHIAPQAMTGSWAGAMGQVQFMPFSFLAFAADGDGDGKKNIWSNRADALASAGHYLGQKGWKRGERWGRAVVLPPDFDDALLGRENKKALSVWQDLGVRLPGGQNLPKTDIKGAIVIPGDGQAFLVYGNYDVLMDWNRSLYFATSVGLLADALCVP